jgi:hypothetical protein
MLGALKLCTPGATAARIMRRGCGGFPFSAAARPEPNLESDPDLDPDPDLVPDSGASLRAIRLAQSPGWASVTEQKIARIVSSIRGGGGAGWRARRTRLLSTAATAAGHVASATQHAWMPDARIASPLRMCSA